MKKYLTLASVLLFGISVLAQPMKIVNKQFDNGKLLRGINKTNVNVNLSNYKPKKIKSGSDSACWFDYAFNWFLKVDPSAAPGFLNKSPIFPDTLVKYEYQVGKKDEWLGSEVHGMAVLFDPHSKTFTQNVNDTMLYSVDSISIPCIYQRHLSYATDTLVVQVLTGFEYPLYAFGNVDWGGIFFNPKTLDLNFQKFDSIYTANKIQLPKTYTYKKLLTAKDTVKNFMTALHLVQLPTPEAMAQPNNGLVVIAVHFIPGYNYVEGTKFNTVNNFLFFSYQENGPDKFPTYVPGDWNCSYVINAAAVDPKQTFYGIYVPEWAYIDDTYPYDNHWLMVKLTYDIPPLKVLVSENDTLCYGDSLILKAYGKNGTPPYTYKWTDNNSTDSIRKFVNNNNSTSLFVLKTSLIITDKKGNQATDSIHIYEMPAKCSITFDGATLISNVSYKNQWYFQNAIITGATGKTHTPEKNGNYYVITGCKDTSNTIKISNASIKEISQNLLAFSVNPNPFNKQAYINFQLNVTSSISIKVYDMLGNEIRTLINNKTMNKGVNKVEFDASGMEAGLYYYKIYAGMQTVTGKMILIK